MAVRQQPKQAKQAHVNMMTDTVIGSLTPDGLRQIMRSLLALEPGLTPVFELATREYIRSARTPLMPNIFSTLDSSNIPLVNAQFAAAQARIRCMVGCGLCYQSLDLLRDWVEYFRYIGNNSSVNNDIAGEFELNKKIASLDADIVQAATAVQKTLAVETGFRELAPWEVPPVKELYDSIISCRQDCTLCTEIDRPPFDRGMTSLACLLGCHGPSEYSNTKFQSLSIPLKAEETFLIGNREVPRIFSGLWQLSSPAWGSASAARIAEHFEKTIRKGFTAFDMADHYGDAEIIFGRFRASYPYADKIFTATKYCVFHPSKVSREIVRANVTERCQRLQASKIDLLQFHWQFYEDPSYIDALRYLQEDGRVDNLGLCNFDTEHLLKVVNSGVVVQSNQVQFSLIDTRPTVKMGQACEEHGIKLLTYGTLCGGFLAESWLGKSEPGLYDDDITPSQRKYYSMIQCWGGWDLFQELLRILKPIATKHNVSISNVATRWVLDFSYVGAVIVGARMGVSDHVDENLASFGWSLDEADHQAIDAILEKSKNSGIFETMGDCGGEYR
ncbi:aryl-alcohol dehydrogenase, putative [Talaromyces stipitatus ATCC 10500]|uniref:Aryl-alcohol dehydrogenase, putative n=1 Tax=Talaromyces stipitatus (strain ATCC 10500 / CBS 375.48 / QM 6759 / NRRL 1006) TaxID=441959 RepID=B8M0E2_TALSN|nr:aryl-alcohol dehydrogenase, putative [Talaromyces stipitatus ATCC 10500]EED21239.1 aryl-alcohol dehydrogenase, putative [Talaromyces stipitatus ATCC 10500]